MAALAKIREVECKLRSQLRILQIARLEGWGVARNYAEVLEGATEDPFLIEARRRVAKEKAETQDETESDEESDC